MPLNDFYTYKILESGAGKINASITINDNHPVFEGHFPGNPVTPGVTQVEMIRKILSDYVGKPLMLTLAKSIKFSAAIIPTVNTEIMLTIKIKEDNNVYKTVCEIYSREKIFTKLNGTFSAN